jgi:hypothetical protein
MTSPDGITWTSQTSAANNYWYSVTYGAGLFVAVSASGTGNRVMTSGVFSAEPSLEPAQWTRHNQALPMPATGSCQDITAEQNSFAAYGTGVSGGWVRGWEPWVNTSLGPDGQRIGGWACIRQLVNTGGDAWRIQP